MGWQDRIDIATSKRLESNKPIWDLVAKVKRDRSISRSKQNRYLSVLYASLSDKDVPQAIVQDVVEFEIGTSFRASLNRSRRTKEYIRHHGKDIFPGDNDKMKDQAFGKLFGITTPITHQAGVNFEAIRLVPRSILKPYRGSSSLAVFYVDRDCKLHSFKTSKVYPTLLQAWSEVLDYKRYVSLDHWILEEAIFGLEGNLANDFKAFMFYGEPGMFLEIDRGSPESPRYASYDATGRPISRNSREITFPGSGVPPEVYEIAKRMSLAAPVAFLRIDFHLGSRGLYLGEITPLPGGVHAGRIYDQLDYLLGRYFAEAEARLYVDLLNGKTFPEFQSVYGMEG